MSRQRWVWLVAAVIGTFVPWFYFGRFFASEGFNLSLFIEQLFATDPASGFVADVLISIGVFWVWSFVDSRRNDVSQWWLVIPAGVAVGLSLALPLYLYLRAATVPGAPEL